MQDPIDDIKAGVSDADIKKKYRLKDDDIVNLHGYNYLITDQKMSPLQALELYPEIKSLIDTKQPLSKPVVSSSLVNTSERKRASLIPSRDIKRPATENTRADIPRDLISKDGDIKLMDPRLDVYALNRDISTPAIQQQVEKSTGIPKEISGKQPLTKEEAANPFINQIQHKTTTEEKAQQRTEERNQKEVDDYYETTTGKIHYNILQPALEALVNAGRGMISSTARLAKNPRFLSDETNNDIDRFADGIQDLFDSERRAKENRLDAFLYGKPTALQGSVYSDGEMHWNKLLPATINTLTTMGTLIGGGAALGGGKLGLITQSYLTTQESYRKEAKEKGLAGVTLDNYSNAAALTTSLLEIISPNNPLLGKFKARVVKEAIGDIIGGVTTRAAVTRALKTTFKEVGKENLQELSQNLGDIMMKAANDKISDGPKFNQDLSYEKLRDQTAETVILTTIATALMMSPHTFTQYKPSTQERQAMEYAAENPEMISKGIAEMQVSGKVNEQQVATMQENLGKYSAALEQVKKSGVPEAQANRVAWETFKSGKLDEARATVAEIPVLNETIGEEIKQEQQVAKENIKDALKGIPEAGTEITGDELATIAEQVPNTSPELLQSFQGKDYRVTSLNLQERYDNNLEFKKTVDEYQKSKEDPEGLRTPPILDAAGNVLDGTKRLAQQFVNGQKTTRVFQEMLTEPINNPEQESQITELTTNPEAATPRAPLTQPLSGITPEAQTGLINKRKAKTSLSPRQEKINALLQDTDSYNNLPAGRLGKGKSEGAQALNNIRIKAQELGLTYDPTRNQLKTSSGTKVQKRFLGESNQAIIENHTPLTERSAPVQSAIQSLYEAAPDKASASIFFPNDITGVDGKRMSDAQLNATLGDVFNGIPSVQAENYLNQFESMVKDGNVLLENEGQKIAVPLDEYMQMMTAAVTDVEQSAVTGIPIIPDDVAEQFIIDLEKEMSSPDFQEWYNDNNFNDNGPDQNNETDPQEYAKDKGTDREDGRAGPGERNESPISENGQGSILQEGQNFETPLTNKEQAKSIADKMRAFAARLEVKGDAAFSRPDTLIRNGILSPAIKLAANIIEAGGSIADGIKAAIEFVKGNQPELIENEIREEVVNTLVDAGIEEPKKRKSLKADITAATSTQVKDKVIEKELTALKRQIKEKFRNLANGELEGISKCKAAGFVKGMITGFKKGVTEGSDIATRAQKVYDEQIVQLRQSIGNMLENAEKRGVFSSTTKARMVNAIAKRINNAKSPLQLLKAMDSVADILNDVEHDKNLNEALSLKWNIAKTIKGKSLDRAASNVGVVKQFLKINPKDVTDLDEYRRIAARVLDTQKAMAVKLSAGKGIVKYETHLVNNSEIKDYTTDQIAHSEELAKQRMAGQYQDLVDIGVIDPAAMSLAEMKAITKAVYDGGETVDETLDRLRAEEAEKKQALVSVVEYQQIGLEDHYVNNPGMYNQEEQAIIENLGSIDVSDLSVKQLVKLNDVINNIVVNNEFYGAGTPAAISEVQRDSKTLAQKIKVSGIKLGSIGSTIINTFSSIHLQIEFITKGSKLASDVQRLSGISDLFTGNARATIKQAQTIKEYQDLKKKYGKEIDNAENRFTRGVYARIIQNLGGTPEEIQKEFDRVKSLLKQTYQTLQASKLTKEQSEGTLVKQVYDSILDGAGDISEVEEKVSDQNKALVNFWMNKFSDTVDRAEASSEIYNNKTFERFNNYTATKAKGVNRGETTPEMDDIFSQSYLSKKIDTSPAKTKLSRMKGGILAKNTVYDLDFDSVQGDRYAETLYDIETAPALAKVKAFFETPESGDLLGGDENKNIVLKSLSKAVLTQKNKLPSLENYEKALTKIANFFQAKAARMALGSISQLPKQYLSVATSTVINLGADMGLYFKALGVSNNIELFNQSSIGTRGDIKAGYNRNNDIASITRTDFSNAAVKTLNDVVELGKKVSEKVLYTLVKSDVSVARTSWLAYYMQDLKRQGVDIETIDWKTAHNNFNKEAGAYAEQMVSRSQVANNNTEASAAYRDVRGFGGIFKSVVLPFSSFSVNQRMRMTNDMQKITSGGEKGEAIRSLTGTLTEMFVFNAIKIYALGWVSTSLARAIAKGLGYWDDEDEADSKKYEDVEVDRGGLKYSTTDKGKKLRAAIIGDFFLSGMGSATQFYGQKALNSIYSATATETYPNGGNPSSHPSLFYNYDPSKNGDPDFQQFGMLGIAPSAVYNLYKIAPEVITGKTDLVLKAGREDISELGKVDLTDKERAVLTASFIIDAAALAGVSDAEVSTINRKFKSILEKDMKEKYGREYNLKTYKKGTESPK